MGSELWQLLVNGKNSQGLHGTFLPVKALQCPDDQAIPQITDPHTPADEPG